MYTTLNRIKRYEPLFPENAWGKLLNHLGKTQPDDEPLPITTILDSLGVEYTLMCLHTVDGCFKELMLYKIWCARQVQHLMTDERSIRALDIVEAFEHGRATNEQVSDAVMLAHHAVNDLSALCGPTRTSNPAWLAARTAVTVGLEQPYYTAFLARQIMVYTVPDGDDYTPVYEATRQKQEAELRRICKLKEKEYGKHAI